MGIVAAFDKVLFTNPASKYCVMRLKTANMMIPQEARGSYHYRDSLTRFVAVGYDLPQTDSIQIDLEGNWVNSKHGLQLQVERWREVVPPTIEGIRGYLSSGLLKGIGYQGDPRGFRFYRQGRDCACGRRVTGCVRAGRRERWR